MAAETTTRTRRRMKRKIAAIAAGLVSVSGAAGASVLIQNFMTAEFNAAPPCIEKVAGADTAFDGLAFTTAGTTTVDGVAVAQEQVTIDGLIGDRMVAMDVYTIENNCSIDLNVSLTNGAQTGNWSDRYLEVWLSDTQVPTDYPGTALSTDWDTAPLVFENAGPGNDTSGAVLIPAGEERPVGVIATTAAAASQVTPGNATWVVEAETP